MNERSPVARAFEGRRQELTDLLRTRLHASTALHYRDADPGLLDERCSRLVLAFLNSLADEPTRLAQYVRVIAVDRFDEGVGLRELQLVLHILESQSWRICDEEIADRGDLVRALGRVSSVAGHAKDALAQVYLDAATDSRRHLSEVRIRLEQLARGTEVGSVSE
jgi:hypothetical protein